jgi:two-component system, NarL family, sensor histidine kinase DesK
VGTSEQTGVTAPVAWSRFSSAAYLLLALAWPAAELAQTATSTRSVALGVALLVFACVTTISGSATRLGITTPRASAVLAGIALATWAAASLGEPHGLVWALVPWFATCLVAVAQRTSGRRAATFLAGTVSIIVSRLAVAGPGPDSWAVGSGPARDVLFITLVAVIPASMLFETWLVDVLLRLHRGVLDAGRLARAEERLRFAADLHDIQGHSLQVIALKAELMARKTAGGDGQTAALAVEVQSLARLALEETRSVAHGYRAVDLGTELRNARDVLRAAGIRCVVTGTDADVVDSEDEPLGFVLREAVTNIFRHSDADEVRITFSSSSGQRRLAIENDGVEQTTTPAFGAGLSNLRRRVERAGGTLHVRRTPIRFCLHAAVPVADPNRAGAAAEDTT